MKEDNWDSILFLREESHKVNLNVLDGGSELGKGVDTGLASSPTPINSYPNDEEVEE